MQSGTSFTTTSIALSQRIAAFEQLGRAFGLFGAGAAWPGHSCGLNETEYEAFGSAIKRAKHRNGWFTEENVRHALRSLSAMLELSALEEWLGRYPELDRPREVRTVGIIMAGNIPLVGFHDLLCVAISGHKARVKCSSDDTELMSAAIILLGIFSPDLAAGISIANERLGDVDALIATGSNNTARYFEHYFGHLPRIVRRSRTSVAVLDGMETSEELAELGEDIFRYFGLGCRNVGKLYVPRDYDMDRVFGAIFPWQEIAKHNKWANNYDYHKAIWLMDRVPLVENGFILLREDTALTSPLGSLYFERYDDRSVVEALLTKHADQIQCIIGHGHTPFGKAQCPGPGEYADNVDTIKFLLELAH